MHRFVSVLVSFVVLLHAMTTLAILDHSQCENMTGFQGINRSELGIGRNTNFSNPNVKAALCFMACSNAISPDSIFHDNGTVNLDAFEGMLLEGMKMRNGSLLAEQAVTQLMTVVRNCTKKTGRDFCDSVVNFFACMGSGNAGGFEVSTIN